MRRYWNVFLSCTILFMLVFTVSGCSRDNGPGSSDLPSPPVRGGDDDIVLTIAWWGSPIRHERTLEVLRMFEYQNPGIRFEAYYFDFDGYITNLNVRAGSGEMWDIFQLGSNYPDFRDNILYLNSFIERGIIDTSQASPEFIEITTSRDNIVGLSNGVNAWGIAYDPSMFIRAGVPLPHAEWTWDDFETAALAIHDKMGIWGIGNFPQDGIVFNQFLSQQGLSLFHPFDRTQLGIAGPDDLVSFLRMRANLVQGGASPAPGESLMIGHVEHDPLVFGLAAMTYLASNQFISLANAALAIDPDRELSMVVLPSHPGGGISATVGSSQMFSISANSRHPEEAARFLDFFANDIDANLVLFGERGVPIMNHVRERLIIEADPLVATVYTFINQIFEHTDGAMGSIPLGHVHGMGMYTIEDIVIRTIERVVMGMITPEEGAQLIYDYAMEIIQQYQD